MATEDTSTETTGITVDPTEVDVEIENAETGVAVSDTGMGQEIAVTPPVYQINWLVRA